MEMLQGRRRSEPWKPTQPQRDSALRLAGANGGFVRSPGDLATELLTEDGGGVRRYTIQPSGEFTLADAESPTRRYVWGERLLLAGMLLSFGTIAVSFLIEAAAKVLSDEYPSIPAPASLLLFWIGLVAFGVGSGLARVAFPLADERWTRIGGPDH
jgi:hypothetical protein